MPTLESTAAWNRARALKLHEHFQTAWLATEVLGSARIGDELQRIQRLIDGLLLVFPGGEKRLVISAKSLRREWDYWKNGGRKNQERPDWIRQPEALICCYKAGCGGCAALPPRLIQEIHRRLTLPTGGRDRHGRSPISAVYQTLRLDFAARRPLPGIDYADYEPGAEFPWTYSTVVRHKPPRTLRALGNRGAAAHKAAGAYVSLNYSNLRRGELYTLDDVRLDIVCIDERTGRAIEVVLYVFMEVGSRAIVGYVMKPAAAIRQEDVDELLAHMLQVPGFGIGLGHTTHLLFERGATACSEGAQSLLEGITHGRIKVHRTGMIGGVRWIGGPRDKARGNAAGKAVIESFNRWLHYALLHLPGQRGNHYDNQPQNLGDLGAANFFATPKSGKPRETRHTLIDQAEQLAQLQALIGNGTGAPHRIQLKLPMLYLFELNDAVREAIHRHNTEPGHAYRGHGTHFQAEVQPGVWRSVDHQSPSTLPKLRQLTNDPAREYAARAGTVEPLPDHVAALILCKKGWSKIERHQIAITLDGEDLVFTSRDSLVIAAKNGTGERVLWALNRRAPHVLHLLTADGRYLESIPRKGEAEWFNHDETARAAHGEAQAMLARDIARIATLHRPTAEAARAATTHNAAQLHRLVQTFPTEETRPPKEGRGGGMATNSTTEGRSRRKHGDKPETRNASFPHAAALTAAMQNADEQRTRHTTRIADESARTASAMRLGTALRDELYGPAASSSLAAPDPEEPPIREERSAICHLPFAIAPTAHLVPEEICT